MATVALFFPSFFPFFICEGVLMSYFFFAVRRAVAAAILDLPIAVDLTLSEAFLPAKALPVAVLRVLLVVP